MNPLKLHNGIRIRMKWQAINFDWNKTRAFLVSAEEGSFSAAAVALNTSQPTISRQVLALEDELNIKLFKRNSQRLELTSAGLMLLEKAKAMGEAAQGFNLVANGHQQSLVGKVVVSVCELDAIYRLPHIIRKFREKHSGISLEIVVSNQASDLNRREADIAVRNFRPEQNDIIARRLGNEQIHLYASQAYAQLHAQQLENSNSLGELQIIAFDESKTIEQQLKVQNISSKPENFKLISANQAMQIQLCKLDQGIIFFAADMAEQEPLLQQVYRDKGALFTLPIWIVSHQEMRMNLRVKLVFDYLAKELGHYLENCED